MKRKIWAARALLADGWAESVAIDIATNGDIEAIAVDTPWPAGEERVED